MGELVSIVYKPKGAVSSEEGYTRIPMRQAQLIVGHGIEGDAKGGRNRQLNIMSAENVQALAREGFCAAPGQLGEQLIIRGLEVEALPAGTRLQIGECACVELLEPRRGCARFEQIQDKLRQEAAGRLGMMAVVVVDGLICIGDPVRLI